MLRHRHPSVFKAAPPTDNPSPTPDYPVLYSPDTTIAARNATFRDFLPLIERYRLVLRAQQADPSAYLSLLCTGISPYSSFKDHCPISELWQQSRVSVQSLTTVGTRYHLRLLAKECKTVLISAEQADAVRAAKSQFCVNFYLCCKFMEHY